MPLPLRSTVKLALLAIGLCLISAGVARKGLAQIDEPIPPPRDSAQEAAETLPAGDAAPLAEQVVDVRILGNDTIPEDQIVGHINTRIGRPFDRSVLQRDVRRLANLGWFVDVKPLENRTAAGRIVIFQVVERPTTRYVTYLGNENVKDKKLGKETGLKVGGSVDPYAVEEGRRKLRDYYHGIGYNNVQVTILEGAKPTDQGVVYLINEGAAEKIWKVDFIGNEFVSDGRLKQLIKSKPPLLKLFKGYLNREKIDADVNQLIAYYRSFGFFQARIGRKLDYNEEGNWVTLTFVINEGPRFEVRNVKFQGVSKFDTAALAEKIELQGEQPFEQMLMQKDALWLQELYGSNGYVFADVKPETVFLEKPGEVDLVYNIDEGGQFRVGRIFVHIGGDNPHTRIQTALNRLSIRPGDIMDIRELKASERRLVASSLFETDAASGVRPKITYRIPDDAEFGLAEGPSDTFRGQSPEDASIGSLAAPVLAPPSARHLQPFQRSLARLAGDREDTEVHVYCKDYLHYQRWQEMENGQTPTTPQQIQSQPNQTQQPQAAPSQKTPSQPIFRGQNPESPQQASQMMRLLERRAQQQRQRQPPSTQAAAPQSWAPVRQVAMRPPSPYQNLTQQQPSNRPAVRGQSPQVQPAYAQVNVPPRTNSTLPYGGQAIQPSGPRTVRDGQVQPAQYSAQTQPPAGSIAPTPLDAQGPLPSYHVFPDGRFGIPGQPYPTQTVDIFVNGNETQTGRLMLGVGVNSNAGVVGNFVIDERNFDWRRIPTSWEDIRNGTAFRGDGQRLRIDASPGSQLNRYLISFQEPYLFDRPISLGLSGSFFDRRYQDWDEQRLGGRVSLGKQWVERDLSATIAYRGENVTISNPSNPAQPDLAAALGDNALHGFQLTMINDTRNSAFMATQGHYIELSGEQVIGTFDYPRLMADLRQYWLLRERPDHSGRHVLSFSTNIGYTGTQTPIYEHFFAGGFATMRGFRFRGASPIDVANGNVQVGGEFQWLNSAQYLFPITADEMLHGVAFCDFGTVEESVKLDNFRVAPGVGLRVSVPAMGPAPIALDFAFPVAYADYDNRQVFSFSMGFSR